MEKKDSDQVASSTVADSPSANVETNQPRNDSMGEEGSFFAGRSLCFSFSFFFNVFLFFNYFYVVYRLR